MSAGDRPAASGDVSVLLCYVEGDPGLSDEQQVRAFHAQLCAEDEWILGAPIFVDEENRGDRTLGVAINLLRPVGRGGEQLPTHIDASLLADVERLVAGAAALTRASDLELAFELDGDPVGWVAEGTPDASLTTGLLEPWRARLRT